MALSILSGAFLFACGGTEDTSGDLMSLDESSTADALSVATCNPRDAASCERGESCLSIDEDTNVCTTGRCLDAGDCRDGYTCRLNHCLRLERDRDPPVRPERDRCDIVIQPQVRGQCRDILAWFWDGRVCSPVYGCVATSPEGLFRTARGCNAAYDQCTPDRGSR